MKIHEKIASIRKTLGISRKEFAAIAGLSPTSVYYFEKKNRVPGSKSLLKILDNFHINPKKFIDGIEPSPTKRQRRVEIDKKWLRTHYLDYFMTTSAIADLLGTSRSTVLSRLREYSIPRRPQFGHSGPQKPRTHSELIGLLESKNPRALHLLNVLTKEEREVVIKRLGLGDEPPQTLASIGEAMDLTRERIRQIQNKALGKMQSFTESRGHRKLA